MIRGLVSFSAQAAFLSTALLPSILGADIRFVPQKPGQNLMDWAHVEINGEIVQGDVEKLRKALAEFDRSIEEYAKAHENDKAYQQRAAAAGGIHGLGNMPVFLNSPGGSVPVALELGKVLRDSYAFTVVSCDGTCSSSCVFVLAGGVMRDLLCNGRIGLHRPRFEYEPFANLSRDEAKETYTALASACAEFMKQMGISEQVFADMLKVPSQQIKFVGRDYGQKYQLLGTDPAWEEWQRARDISYWGEEWVKARDRLFDCYKSGGSDAVCRERYEKDLREINARRRAGP